MKVSLHPLDPVNDRRATTAAGELSRMNPWLRLGVSEDALFETLNASSPFLDRYAICRTDDLVGVAVLHRDWLFGDYLKLFGVFSQVQQAGIGGRALQMICDLSRQRGGRNLWACVSAFNDRAIQFYERNGFEKIGSIADLVVEGEHELFIRKRLSR